MKYLSLIIFLIVAVTACKEDFDIPPQAKLKASLFASKNQKDTSSVISISSVGHDSLFYKDQKVKLFLVPLSPENSTRFAISFDKVYDTITFVHRTDVQYSSMESGFFLEYKLKSVTSTHHKIASIQITDSLVTNTLHENIKIYILPLPAGSK